MAPRSVLLKRVLSRVLEIAAGYLLYRVYATLRNAQGRDETSGAAFDRAYRHGRDVLHLERLLHLDAEHLVQDAVLRLPHEVVQALGVYYATVHLPLTALTFAWLLVSLPHRQFTFWRNTLVLGTGAALLGFALFPTLPPRLFPPGSGYVDTLQQFGGLWSYRTPALEHIAHPYAAMPSLHLVWASWVGLAVWHVARRSWARWLGPAHVAVTVLVVVATGNHWLLDAVAGTALLALAAWAARALHRARRPAPVLAPEAPEAAAEPATSA